MLTKLGEIKVVCVFIRGIFKYIKAASAIPDMAIMLDITAKVILKSVCSETIPCCKVSTSQCLSIPNILNGGFIKNPINIDTEARIIIGIVITFGDSAK